MRQYNCIGFLAQATGGLRAHLLAALSGRPLAGCMHGCMFTSILLISLTFQEEQQTESKMTDRRTEKLHLSVRRLRLPPLCSTQRAVHSRCPVVTNCLRWYSTALYCTEVQPCTRRGTLQSSRGALYKVQMTYHGMTFSVKGWIM